MNPFQPIYYIPVLAFIIIALIMYFLEEDSTKKNKTDFILIRVVLPAFTVALVSFVIIKYKDTGLFSQEKMMQGNYFDLPTNTPSVVPPSN
jgi:hypothetical protein